MPALAFVMADRQTFFFRELVDALRDELEQLGIQTTTTTGAFPPLQRDLAYALVPPHEYFNLRGQLEQPSAAQLARTIFVCAEQPGTWFFDENVRLASGAHAVFDINPEAVEAFRVRGVEAHYLQLGYTSQWDRFDGTAYRDVDVLFLGSYTGRRSTYLAGYADSLSRWRSHIALSDGSRPNADPAANFVVDEEKWRLFGRSKVLLNLHQDTEPYFEWLRIVQAMLNGCVVVSEHSIGYEPLSPGEHFLSGRPETLALLAGNVLVDDERRAEIQRSAYEFLRDQVPLSRAAEELATAVEDAAARPLMASDADPTVVSDRPAEGEEAEVELWLPPPPVALTEDKDMSVVRRALKTVALGLLELNRSVERLSQAYSGESGLVRVESVSRAYAAAAPTVSVLTSSYNHAHVLPDALTSAAGSTLRDLEIVVVDDGSTDDTVPRVREWMADNAHVPAILLRHPVNRGLGHGRNSALGFARGRFSFVLDADNVLYPHAIERLLDALESVHEATFAWGMQQRHGPDDSQCLWSFFPWEPDRFRTVNYIDSMALFRTEVVRDLGGYTTDLRLHGWEDYDLWCRIAEHGGNGVLVPEIIARYLASPHSMLNVTNISWTIAYSVLIERHPTLMRGLSPPL